MSLKRAGMIEQTSGTSALSLTAEAGESILVRDIRSDIAAAGAEDYKVTIDRKSILQFKAPTTWHLLARLQAGTYPPIMEAIKKAGLFPTFPVAEGETFGITAPGTSDYLTVVYDLYDGDDIQADMANGSKASRYRMFQMISNSASPTEAGDEALDQSDLDSEFIAFPGGDVVPPGVNIELLGLFGIPVTDGTGAANAQNTSHLKFLADREDIFDKDLNGINFLADITHTAATTIYGQVAGRLWGGLAYQDAGIIVFDEPLIFVPGSELNVFATIVETTGGTDLAAGAIKLGMIMDVVKR